MNNAVYFWHVYIFNCSNIENIKKTKRKEHELVKKKECFEISSLMIEV